MLRTLVHTQAQYRHQHLRGQGTNSPALVLRCLVAEHRRPDPGSECDRRSASPGHRHTR
jgi:hypothetical protein